MIRAIKSLSHVGRLHTARSVPRPSLIPSNISVPLPAAAVTGATASSSLGNESGSGTTGGSSASGVAGLSAAAAISLGLTLLMDNEEKAMAECEKVPLDNNTYPIGTVGQPWGDAEKKQWLDTRKKHDDRSYNATVVGSVWDMAHTSNFEGFHPVIYGELTTPNDAANGTTTTTTTEEKLPLLAFVPNAFKPRQRRDADDDPSSHSPNNNKHYFSGDCTNEDIEAARSKPTILITGGTHGYETSGIKGALDFLSSGKAKCYAKYFNIVIVPCVSPWSYERNERWVATAEDPNRSFGHNHNQSSSTPPMPMRTVESTQLLDFLDSLRFTNGKSSASSLPKWLCHIDLHETTDSDVQEFRPAKAARDGLLEYDNHIPDGFYLVGDSCDATGAELKGEDRKDRLDFYNAILRRVAEVTHMAETDPDGTVAGYPATSKGLLLVPCKEMSLCAGGAVRDAPYVATTEVYPDSERTTEEDCIKAQVEAICAALDYLLKKGVALVPCECNDKR